MAPALGVLSTQTANGESQLKDTGALQLPSDGHGVFTEPPLNPRGPLVGGPQGQALIEISPQAPFAAPG